MFTWAATKLAMGVAGKFLFAQWKWIVIGLIVVALLVVSFKVYGAFKDRAALLEEKKGTIATLAVDLNTALIEAQTAKATVERMQVDQARLQALAANLITTQIEIRDEVRAQKAVFESHDFDQLVQAKPGLIQKKANRATQERFDELEAVFNR